MSALQSLTSAVSTTIASIRRGRNSMPGDSGTGWVDSWTSGTNAARLLDRSVTYGALYRAQPSIATVVDKRANATARLTLNTWDVTAKTGKTLDSTSDLARLIAKPSHSMSSFAFWRWVSSTYDIYGEAFLLKARDEQGRIASLVPISPTTVQVSRDSQGRVVYVIGIGPTDVTVPESDMIALLRYNPDSMLRGMSRLEPLRSTLEAEDAARRAQSAFWKNGARPATIIKSNMSLTPAAAERIKAIFNFKNGGVDNVGGTAVIDEGMSIEKMQLDLEEMQYVESRKLNMTEVCMVFDMPPPVVHILDKATFSNIVEQMRSMYRDTMAPHLEDIESCLAAQLVPEFYGNGERVISFALDEVLRGDIETRADTAVKLVTNGIATPNEVRPWFDLSEFTDVADVLYANQATQPLGTPVASASAATPDPATPPTQDTTSAEQAPPVPPAPVSRSVKAMAGRIKADPSSATRHVAKALRTADSDVLADALEACRLAFDSDVEIEVPEFPDDDHADEMARDLVSRFAGQEM